jgi:hypothetical protein
LSKKSASYLGLLKKLIKNIILITVKLILKWQLNIEKIVANIFPRPFKIVFVFDGTLIENKVCFQSGNLKRITREEVRI